MCVYCCLRCRMIEVFVWTVSHKIVHGDHIHRCCMNCDGLCVSSGTRQVVLFKE